MEVNYLDIAKTLSLKEDDVLLITGNISLLAFYETRQGNQFDIQKFIDSFKLQLPQGALFFHAFNDNLVSGDTFDYKRSKPNTGSLSVAAWKDQDFVRTKDPFHSFLIWGEDSDYLQQINNKSTFGKDSVFAYLHQKKAKMLIINVLLENCFTFVHYCEECIGVDYRKFVKHNIQYVSQDDKKSIEEKWFYTRKAGYYNSFAALEKALEDEKIMQVIPLNESVFKMIDLAACYDFIEQEISGGNTHFLCSFSYKKWLKDVAKMMLVRS